MSIRDVSFMLYVCNPLDLNNCVGALEEFMPLYSLDIMSLEIRLQQLPFKTSFGYGKLDEQIIAKPHTNMLSAISLCWIHEEG